MENRDNEGKTDLLTVGVVGLGLIGGSFAKAYKGCGHTVFGYDADDSVNQFAVLSGVLDGKLDSESIKSCDLILIALYPEATVEYIKSHAADFSSHTLVIDCCGIKRDICPVGFSMARDYGFTFVGGHPMAGTHNSGFKYSNADLYRGAPMVIVPPVFDDMELFNRVKVILSPAGFGRISVTTAAEHDKMIAFTSQLAHIISSAYIKSPSAASHDGFSAGSYKDMTRVAWLNPDMWTELFLKNRENLLFELDSLTSNLNDYRRAIENFDATELRRLLDEGRLRKEAVDADEKN